MANYYSSTLQKGSKGDEVKQWQQFLNTQGYNLDVDGIFGGKTYAATTTWQGKNGLDADGIVGEQTWGKAGYSPYSTGSTSATGSTSNTTKSPNIGNAPTAPTFNTTTTTKPTANPLPNAPTYDTTKWDDTTKGQVALGNYNSAKDAVNNYGNFTYDDYLMGEDAQAAKDALNAHNANKPGAYQSQWQSQLDALMGQIMNRDKFSYDLNGDALYQQYKDKYIQQGKLAMGDAVGQASAMTGGYGNSYAQSVGQQQYQAQLQNLNDIVPQLYQMALDKYNQEGQDLYNQYGLVADRENLDYGRYRDTVSDYLTERDYLQGRYDSERNFDYGQYVDDRNLDYTLHQDGYSKLLDALGIAQSDYYDGANMFQSEQANRNNIAGQEFSDAMSIWGAESDEAWKKYQADEDARQYANSLLQQGYQNEFGAWEANANNAWKQAEWEEAARQYANEEAWRQKEWELTNEQWDWQKSQAEADRSESNAKDYHESEGKVGYDNGSLTDAQIKEMQNALGINADGKWGSGSTEAAGGLTADEAWKAYKDGKLGKTGLSYEDIEDELNYYISQGADKSEINNYLREAYQSGYISYEEYNKLKEAYAPRGYTYGITTQATPAIK